MRKLQHAARKIINRAELREAIEVAEVNPTKQGPPQSNFSNIATTIVVAVVTTIAANILNWRQFWEESREPLEVKALEVFHLSGDQLRNTYYYAGNSVGGLSIEMLPGNVPQFVLPVGSMLNLRVQNRNSSPLKIAKYSVSAITNGNKKDLEPLPGIPGVYGRVFLVVPGSEQMNYLNLGRIGFDAKAFTTPIAPHSDMTGIMFFKSTIPTDAGSLDITITDTEDATHHFRVAVPAGVSFANEYSYEGFNLESEKPESVPASLRKQILGYQ
jgi:hypothetical protein